MSELPPGWAMATLGAISAECSQRVPKVDERFQYIDIACIDRETKRIVAPQFLVGASAPSRARKEVRSGDVLVSMTRPNLNAVALVPVELDAQIASTGLDVLRPLSVEPRWLFNLVRTRAFVDSMSELVQGALYPAVRSKDVRGFAVPVAPLAEQKRIADKLDALLARVDACRERLDRVTPILNRFRQSVLAAATSGELTREWREARGQQMEWERTSVTGVATDVFDGPFGSHLKSKDYVDAGVRVVRLENIAPLRFVEEKRTYISHEKYESLIKHTLLAGDILFSSFVDEEVRVCLLPDQLDRNAINKADCFCIRTNPQKCRPNFLMMRLACKSTFDALDKVVHGVTRPRINLGQLREIAFDLPSLDEQDEIIRRSSAIFNLADALDRRLGVVRNYVECTTLSSLDKAFRGELVPQYPSDEPATQLLAKIGTERFTAAAEHPRKRTMIKQKRTTMSDTGKEAIKTTILRMKSKVFSFDDLRDQVSEDYESLKAAVFELLEEKNPIIRQVFNKKIGSIEFERVTS